MDTLGATLKQIRTARRLTQTNVAEILHCDRSVLSRIETGSFAPSFEMIKNLAKIYGIDCGELIARSNSGKDIAVTHRVIDLVDQKRELEAQAIAIGVWWDLQEDIDHPQILRLYDVIMNFGVDEPETWAIILGHLIAAFRKGDQATVGYDGLQLQKKLGNGGHLAAARMIGRTLLSLQLDVTHAAPIRLDYGTTLFRLGATENARISYQRAIEELATFEPKGTRIAQAMHGLSACELNSNHVEEAGFLSREACNRYESAGREALYFLALQNHGIALKRQNNATGLDLLVSCADYWESRDNVRLHSVMEEIE